MTDYTEYFLANIDNEVDAIHLASLFITNMAKFEVAPIKGVYCFKYETKHRNIVDFLTSGKLKNGKLAKVLKEMAEISHPGKKTRNEFPSE